MSAEVNRVLKYVFSAALPCSLVIAPFLAEFAFAASAGHGAEHGPAGVGTLLYPALNFILFAGILVFAYRKIGKAKLIEQHTDVKEHLRRAAEDFGAAESAFNHAQGRLGAIEEEKQALIATLNQEGADLSDIVLAKAEQAVENSLLDTKRRIDNEVARTETELRHEVVRRAASSAREKVVGRLNSDDDARLRRETIQRIG